MVAISCPSTAEEAIRLLYSERRPFYYLDPSGAVEGTLAEPTIRAFQKAGIPFEWQLMSANGILNAIRESSYPACSPGWYKSRERELYANYTKPIYRDLPLVGLAHSEMQYEKGQTAKNLLERRDFKLLVKKNYLSGPYLDALISKVPREQIVESSDDISVFVRLIYMKRADIAFVTQEEVESYVGQAKLNIGDFKVIKFPDITTGQDRHILCNHKVPRSVVDALNKAITSTVRLVR